MTTVAALTFADQLADMPDPYAGFEASLLQAYAENNLVAPADCRVLATSTDILQCYLVADRGTGRPAVTLSPFAYQSLPGIPDPRAGSAYWFIGDVSGGGTFTNLGTLENNFFNRAQAVTVPTITEMTAAWTNRPAAETHLPVYALGADNTELVRARHCVPIPHPYAVRVLEAYSGDTLSWRFLWESVGSVIVADNALVELYGPLLDFVRVASTYRAQVNNAAANAPDFRLPEVAKELTPVMLQGKLAVQAHERLHRLLPALRAPTGIGQQLQSLAATQQLQSAQMLANQAAAKTPANFEQKASTLASTIRLFSEVDDTALLSHFWLRDYANLKSSQMLPQLEARLAETAHRLAMPTPLISVTVAQDIINGRFTAGDVDLVTRGGVSIFRIRVLGTDDARLRDEQNLTFSLMTSGSATSTVDATQLVLKNNDVVVIDSDLDFISTLQAYYVLLVTLLSDHSRLVQAYHDQIVPLIADLTRIIRRRCFTETDRKTTYMKVLLFIWRVTESYLCTLAQSPNRHSVPAPDFSPITTAARGGTLGYLTELPATLFNLVNGRGNDYASGAIAPRTTATANPSAPASASRSNVTSPAAATGNERIVDTSHNPRLRQAWNALGVTSIYRSPGDRFHDTTETTNRNRKKVLGDDGSPLCLPFALTGRCYGNCTHKSRHNRLSDGEERRVAAAANPPFNL